MDDTQLRVLINAVISRLTGNPDRAARESFMRRDIKRAAFAVESGSDQERREAAAALRVW